MAAEIEAIFKNDKLQEKLKTFKPDDIQKIATTFKSDILLDPTAPPTSYNTNPFFYQPEFVDKPGTTSGEKIFQKVESDTEVPKESEVLNVIPVFQMLIEFSKETNASLKGLVTADFLNSLFSLPTAFSSKKLITDEDIKRQTQYKTYVEDMYKKLLPTFQRSIGGGLKQRKKSITRRRARAPPVPS